MGTSKCDGLFGIFLKYICSNFKCPGVHGTENYRIYCIFQLTVHVEHSQLAFSTVFPNENTVHIHNYIKMKKAYGHKKIFQLCLPFLSP